MMNILNDKEIRHSADAQGLGICREQTIEHKGKTVVVRFWYQLETMKLHHVDSVTI